MCEMTSRQQMYAPVEDATITAYARRIFHWNLIWCVKRGTSTGNACSKW